ncbi:MAG: hypothetical protein IT270_00295 [Saprospiraceae bacterium]|nr:hypothetical protein [Saprospiraceae bacterium]
MTETCFHNHTDWVCDHLKQAKYSIRIAMCWFSNPRIFQTILEKLQEGISTELVIEFDDNNIREGGLDFDHFIQSGGLLFAAHDTTLMHHKFAIIDDTVLLTGSFNWTNNTNTENTIACDEKSAVQTYLQEFTNLKNRATQLHHTTDLAVKTTSRILDQKNTISHEDLRKKIASGSKCWVIKLEKAQLNNRRFFQQNQFPFDPEKLSQPYWTQNTQFSPTHFENWLNSQTTFTVVQIRYLNTWYRRIRPGDVLLPIGPKNNLLCIGVVQPGNPQGTQRQVTWIQTAIPTIHLQGQYPSGAPVQYLSSGMQLLQAIFTTQT